MANGNIGDAPASTFAEYVKEPPSGLVVISQIPEPDSGSEGESASESELDALSDAPSQSRSESDSALRQPRPLLAHRLHSHRLHVQEKAKSRRARLLSGPLVDIYVGESKRHWALHRNLLCHHSEHLASILLPPDETKKKAENKLDLLDDDPAGFELLVKWLYQGKLDDVSNLPDPLSKYDYAVSCHKLYLLCDRFEMPQLKNIAMDQYRKGLSEARLVPDAAEMNEIYRNSSEGSPFRRLMTKIAARQIMDPDSEKDAESYRECFDGNLDFAIDLVNAIKMGTGGLLFDDPTYGDECEYHDHDAGPNCHIRGKGRAKQVYKAPPRRARKSVPPAPSASLENPPLPTPTASPDPPRPLLPPLPTTLPHPRPPHRPCAAAGPLRRGLTAPASSTVSTSKEIATGTQTSPSPKEQRDKFRMVPGEGQVKVDSTVPDGRRPSYGDGLHPPVKPPDSKPGASAAVPVEDRPSRTGIWEWAGVGNFGIMWRKSHSDLKAPASKEGEGVAVIQGTQDDFIVPSTIVTDVANGPAGTVSETTSTSTATTPNGSLDLH